MTTPMPDVRDGREFLAMKVFDSATGARLGRVTNVLVDPESQRVLGFVVKPNGRRDAQFLPFGAAAEIGDDSIMVHGTPALEEMDANERASELAASGIHLLGSTIVTERGDDRGGVARIMVRPDGRVASYDVSKLPLRLGRKTRIPAESVQKVGADTIIVSDSADVPTNERVDFDSGHVETLEDGSVSVPLIEEQLVITKRRVVRERIIIHPDMTIERQTVEDELHRERIEIGDASAEREDGGSRKQSA